MSHLHFLKSRLKGRALALRHRLALIGCLAVLVGGTAPAYSDLLPHTGNLLVDSSFESGSLQDPFTSAARGQLALDTTEALTGDTSLRLSADDTNAYTLDWRLSPRAAVATVSGEESFELKAWVKADTAGRSVKLYLFCLDESYDFQTYPSASDTFTAGTDWSPISLTHTCPTGSSFASVRLQTVTTGSITWWDDVSLTRTEQRGSNLLANGSFEGSTLPASMTGAWSGSLSFDSSIRWIGRYSLRHDATGPDSYTQPFQLSPEAAVLPLDEDGGKLELSAWVKATAAGTQTQLRIFCLDAGYDHLTYPSAIDTFSVGTDWQKVSLEHSCEPGAKFVSIRLDTDGAGATTWWDEVRLVDENHFVNLIPDPDFESGALQRPMLGAVRATLDIDAGVSLTGSYSLKLTTTDNNDGFTTPYQGSDRSALIALDGETPLRLSAWAKADSADVPVELRIYCLDAAYAPGISTGLEMTTVGTDWQRLSLEHTCPETASFAGIRLDVDQNRSTVWWDQLAFGLGATPYDILREHYAIYAEAQDQSFGQIDIDFQSFDHYQTDELAALSTANLFAFDPNGQFDLKFGVNDNGPAMSAEAWLQSVWRHYGADEVQAWQTKIAQAPTTAEALVTLVAQEYAILNSPATFQVEGLSTFEVQVSYGSNSSQYRALSVWLTDTVSGESQYVIVDPVLVGVANIDQRIEALSLAEKAMNEKKAGPAPKRVDRRAKSGNPSCKEDTFPETYRYHGRNLDIDIQTTGVAMDRAIRKTDNQGHESGNHWFEGAVDLTCQCYENCDNVATTRVYNLRGYDSPRIHHGPGCHTTPFAVAHADSTQTNNGGGAVWGHAAMGYGLKECADFGIGCYCSDFTVNVGLTSGDGSVALIEAGITMNVELDEIPLKIAASAQCPACTRLFFADVTVKGLANGQTATIERSYIDDGRLIQAFGTAQQSGTANDDIEVQFPGRVPDGAQVTFTTTHPSCGEARSFVRGEDLALSIHCGGNCGGVNDPCPDVALGGTASGISHSEHVNLLITTGDGQTGGKLVGSDGFYPFNVSAAEGTGFSVSILAQSNENKVCTLSPQNGGVVGPANTNNNSFFNVVHLDCQCPAGGECEDPTPPSWEDGELRSILQQINPPSHDLWPFDVGVPAPSCDYNCPENMEPTFECTDVYDDEGNFLYEDCTLDQPTCRWECDFGFKSGPSITGSTLKSTGDSGLELLNIDLTARDNEDGVDGFLIFIDDQLVKGIQTPEAGPTGSISTTLDVSDYPDGSHQLMILALDDAQGIQTPTMEVLTFETTAGAGPCASDSAGPGLSVLPSAGSILPPGPVSIQAFADDENLVDRVKIWIDGEADTFHSEPWIRSWNATPGVHDIMVRAWDSCGNFRTLNYQLTVQADCTNDSTYPVVTLDSPAHGASLTEGVVTLEASASDANGIASVEFKVGGTVVGTDSVAPYEFDWAATPGAFSVTARAVDGCNLAATSSAHTVTVTEAPADCSTDSVGPVVQISSPIDGGQLNAGQTVSLAATAVDTSGVEKVQFFVDDNLLSADMWAPYQGSWNPGPGVHTIKARGIDHCGNMRAQEITVTVGDPSGCDVDSTDPSIGWVSPLQGDLVSPGTLDLEASAADASGIEKVQFFVDGTLIAADTGSPYGLPWQAAPGAYTLKARAIDTCGRMAASEIAITVGQANACDSDNVLPTVSVTSPANGASLTPGQIGLTANASDTNGVERVQFFVDGALIGADFDAPYATTWTAPPGSHTIKARATDLCGNLKAQEITVTVGDPAGCDADSTKPWINLVTPAAGSTLNAGTPVSLSAQASDDSGIEKVQFFVDGSLIGADHTAPYDLMWNPSPGDHEVKARALDTCGNLKADIHVVNAQ